MKKIKQVKKVVWIILVLVVAGAATQVYSHCQIPCAIFDDAARLKMIDEHIGTIDKAMRQIVQLSENEPVNMNQVVRWINNKDDHADELSEIVTHYFMAQRVKPVSAESAEYKDYLRQLTLLHEMLVTSMKCKQTTDLAYVEKLKDLLKDFSAAYQE
jgi:nickel superoxide dismutase